ncbi:MAG: hypothetical protein HQ582_20145, partial [Planctomycetes bacterium]|nr:hypothetical protein [Planctomycetota bacterium]
MAPLHALVLVLLSFNQSKTPQINPVPRPALSRTLAEWTFDTGTDGWAAEQHCAVAADVGLLKITATEDDPYMHRRVDYPGGQMLVQLRARSTNSGAGAVYWTTAKSPQR